MIDHIPTDDLSALIDGALQPARRDQVEVHLAGCATCRGEFESLRWAVDFARALPPAPMPEGLALRLPEASAARAARELALEPARIRPWTGLLALAAVLTLGLLLGRMTTLSRETAAPGGAESAADIDSLAMSEMADAAADAIAAGSNAPGSDLDIDSAAGLARRRVESDDAPETLLQPLATALTDDRALAGELGRGSAIRSDGPGAAATASAVAADAGGYRPPDAQVPGAAAARDDSAPVAATASALTAVRATAETALVVLNASELPPDAGGGSPELAATREALAAMQPEATLAAVETAMAALPASASQAARAGAAVDPAAPPELVLAAYATATALAGRGAKRPEAGGADASAAVDARASGSNDRPATALPAAIAAGPSAPPPTARIVNRADAAATEDAASQVSEAAAGDLAGEAAETTLPEPKSPAPAAVPGAPPAAAAPTPRLLVPLAAITVGLLALGLLLLRQVGRQRRRRRHLDL